ncbi:hypothetical protein J6TS1_48760 [Siminovitchia terrae]|uniref:Uncharacterized protein n=1 Tax=Siminovitchia terrae TaxID=1914933 RepID=A0ABQ4L4F2_SIMTE|nr:hypothetical protein J6TS1_48760 [Siminovitchia terrae]
MLKRFAIILTKDRLLPNVVGKMDSCGLPEKMGVTRLSCWKLFVDWLGNPHFKNGCFKWWEVHTDGQEAGSVFRNFQFTVTLEWDGIGSCLFRF